MSVQIFDDVAGLLLLAARSQRDQTIRSVLADFVQGGLEARPAFLLLGREAQIGLDTGRARVSFSD